MFSTVAKTVADISFATVENTYKSIGLHNISNGPRLKGTKLTIN